MPGLFQLPADLPIGQAIDELFILALAGILEDCENQILFLPL